MKTTLCFALVCLLVSVSQALPHRHRRQYAGYGYAPQYGVRETAGQGWMNNNNLNPYLNQQAPGWNNNNNYQWNQGSARPAWYNNTASCLPPSMLVCFLTLLSIVVMF